MRRAAIATAQLLQLFAAAAQAAPVDCLVAPHRVADLAFATSGVVREVGVERGDHVAKGQVLASLDTSIEQANLDIAQAQYAATAATESAQAQLDLAAKRLARARVLLDRDNLAASKVEDIQSDFDVARLRLAELQETRRLRALDVARAAAILAARRIASPFDGVVVERHVAPGETVDSRKALTVAEVDPLFVDIIAPAAAFDRVKAGQAIPVRLDHPAGRAVAATATVIDPYVDASSGTFRIRAALPNPDLSVIAGFRCRAELPFEPGDAD